MTTGAYDSQQEDVRRFFSGFAVRWDSLYGGRRNVLWRTFDAAFRRDVYERYQMTFEELGDEIAGASVLDIGCGSGIYCCEAARRGAARVVGVDIADDMVALADARSRDEGCDGVCEFVVSDFPANGVSQLVRVFDFGIVMGVMDYVADAELFLAALRPLIGRRVVLSFPGRHWLRGPLRRYRYKLLGRCDVRNYDEATIRHACAAAGFGRTDIRRLDHSGICYIVTAHAR